MVSSESSLTFDINLRQVLFNSSGQFYLTLRLQGSSDKQNDVKLSVNNAPYHMSVFTSQPYEQVNNGVPISLGGLKLSYQLPQGFIDQDVYLLVEVHRFTQDASDNDTKYGDALLLVYPNKDTLFPSTNRLSDDKEVLCKIDQLMELTVKTRIQGVVMNVGSLWLDGELRHQQPNNEEKEKPAPKPVKSPKRETTPVIEPLQDEPGPSHALPAPLDEDSGVPRPSTGKIPELPLGPMSSPAHPRHLCGSFVARQGYTEVAVLLHAAAGLPVLSDGSPPRPFIIGKSREDCDNNVQSQSVTHASSQPTQKPSWHEVILVEFPSNQSPNHELVLMISDGPSNKVLVEYEIPVSSLKPSCPYNLELVKANEDFDSNSRLYLSLILKHDSLVPFEEDNMYGLEFSLRGFESAISNPSGSLIAVARVVFDWYKYKEEMLSNNPSTATVSFTTITFPSPHPTSFSAAGQTMGSGSPQVTLCGQPVNQPQWNQSFFIPGDMTSLFSGSCAFCVEFYSMSHAFSDNGWSLSGPIGYCNQMLSRELLTALQQDDAKHGLRIHGLPVQGSISSISGAKPSVSITARCIFDKCPEEVPASKISSLPIFGTDVNQFSGQPITQHNNNRFGLPPFDAVQRLLPFNSGLKTSEPPQASFLPPTAYGEPSSMPLDVHSSLDARTLALLDYQTKEVDKYRTAMRKLATDLLHLKQENARLQEANSQYRRDLSQHDEISRMMISANNLDNVTHSELIQKFVMLKKKLSEESTKRQDLQKRTQKLQNDLIKKNEKEKSLYKLEEAHESQQELVQKMQMKLQKYKSLQETCKKQEQVIIELEKLLSRGNNGVKLTDINSQSKIYIEENVRLRLELEKYKEIVNERESKRNPERKSSPSGPKSNEMENTERLELYQKLERAEGRIIGLETQLTENARKWAKERTSLQAKLNETLLERHSLRHHDERIRNEVGPLTPNNFLFNDRRRSSPKLDPLIRR